MIELSFGGEFDENGLVEHIRRSGRDYIIQGQQTDNMESHHKPSSLDSWLRQMEGVEANKKQADNNVIQQLVDTGLFTLVSGLICPDTGVRSKGLKIVE